MSVRADQRFSDANYPLLFWGNHFTDEVNGIDTVFFRRVQTRLLIYRYPRDDRIAWQRRKASDEYRLKQQPEIDFAWVGQTGCVLINNLPLSGMDESRVVP